MTHNQIFIFKMTLAASAWRGLGGSREKSGCEK